MNRFTFSTDFTPQSVDDRARLARWHETVQQHVNGIDVSFDEEKPLSIHFQFAPLGAVSLGSFAGTLKTSVRTQSHINADGRDDFMFCVSKTACAEMTQRSRVATVAPGQALFNANGLPYRTLNNETAWSGLILKRGPLAEIIADPENLVLQPIDPELEAVRYLNRYVEWLNRPETTVTGPLVGHVDRTLMDLIGLVLGAGRDFSELAKLRGLRAARMQDVIAEVSARFSDPSFSAHQIAQRLGVSVRYVQELLAETGRTFAERVLELRLQKARAMLSDRKHDRLKVSDIALACGFNEVSYFNRCFRRRFGSSPTEYRGSSPSV